MSDSSSTIKIDPRLKPHFDRINPADLDQFFKSISLVDKLPPIRSENGRQNVDIDILSFGYYWGGPSDDIQNMSQKNYYQHVITKHMEFAVCALEDEYEYDLDEDDVPPCYYRSLKYLGIVEYKRLLDLILCKSFSGFPHTIYMKSSVRFHDETNNPKFIKFVCKPGVIVTTTLGLYCQTLTTQILHLLNGYDDLIIDREGHFYHYSDCIVRHDFNNIIFNFGVSR